MISQLLKVFLSKLFFIERSGLLNPHKYSIKNHLELISGTLDIFTTKYENILLLGNFNACTDDETMKSFCSSYDLHSLIKQTTCYKNSENQSCIDLILTNKVKSFQSICVIKTGLSDFHRMTIFVLEMHFRKLPPKVISYRDFKNFANDRFVNSLQSALNNQNSDKIKMLKILTYFSTSVIRYLTSMYQERKSIYAGIIKLS